ncbi:MAG: DUF5916 domain-containing protein [Acidobacteriota bacterium]
MLLMPRIILLTGAMVGFALLPGFTAAEDSGATSFGISRSSAPITVDGELDDPGWQGVVPVRTWYETNPGDNVEPEVVNLGYLSYDEKYFYAGFRFADPEPSKIRAPLADRDNVPPNTDYGGVILDTQNGGKTAQMFLANPRGIQYDAINSDASGEDSAPDFHWESAARITDEGWNLEIRIPFSSLRYDSNGGGPQTWRVMLYRNYPRDFRYQMFTSRLPRDVNCFICNSRPLNGLSNLPSGGHLVVAPFFTSAQLSEPTGDLGTPLASGDIDFEPGLDVKWAPNPDTVIDATLNPDFSQVESDVAQIATNERFALFFPERRPFFLEGIDLFRTPLRAVYTRSFTAPRWGARVTGKVGANAYTLLVGEDQGGGGVIIPGTDGSEIADQDFDSLVTVGRWRRDLGERSFLSFLISDRKIEGGGNNRVFGPDFEWRPNGRNTVTGQLLWSTSQTPNRPDLADEWDGRELSGYALETWWRRGTDKEDWFLLYRDIDDEFRADNGFVSQVGYREAFFDTGYTFRPQEKRIHRVRTFFIANRQEDQDGGLIYRQLSPGFGMSGKKNFFGRFRLAFDEVRAIADVETDAGTQRIARLFERTRFIYTFDISPTKRFSRFRVDGVIGDEIDFSQARLGKGGRVNVQATFRPNDHIELQLLTNRRWLDLELDDGRSGRLFTAQVSRLRGVYTFNARSWLRLIGQYVETERDPSLYAEPEDTDDRSGFFSGSAVFAYKLNWQTVLFVGYGDNRELDDRDRLEPESRQLFLKMSYAFRR